VGNPEPCVPLKFGKVPDLSIHAKLTHSPPDMPTKGSKPLIERCFFRPLRAERSLFSHADFCLRLFISISYRGVRCSDCSTMQDFAELSHTKFTRRITAFRGRSNHDRLTRFARGRRSPSLLRLSTMSRAPVRPDDGLNTRIRLPGHRRHRIPPINHPGRRGFRQVLACTSSAARIPRTFQPCIALSVRWNFLSFGEFRNLTFDGIRTSTAFSRHT
jgi:hypothetical protein